MDVTQIHSTKFQLRRFAAVAAVAISVFTLTGCASSESRSAAADTTVVASDPTRKDTFASGIADEAADAAADGATDAPAQTTPASAATQTSQDTPAVVASPVAPSRRDVIYTADSVIQVVDATAEANRIRRDVIAAGGWLLADERTDRTARMVLKVLPTQFDSTVNGLSKNGKVLSQSINASDVTAQMVDLEARLKSAEISRERVRALLAGATKLADVIALESELGNREAAVEQMQGQLNVIRNQVGYGTINVTLQQPVDALIAPIQTPRTTPAQGFRTGWNALVRFLSAGAVFLAVLAPWAPLMLLVGLAIRFAVRRSHKLRAARMALQRERQAAVVAQYTVVPSTAPENLPTPVGATNGAD
jgi:Domain of unknown function (DUF4349)